MKRPWVAVLCLAILVPGCTGGDPPLSAAEKRRLAAILQGAERLIGEGRPDRARTALEEALEMDPSSADARSLLAATYSAEGNHTRALEILGDSLRDSPDHPGLLSARGGVHEALEDFPMALRDYRSALEIRPDDPALQLRIAVMEMRLRKFEEAGRVARIAAEMGVDDAEVHLVLGSAADEAGDLPAAEASLRQCLDRKPSIVEARYRLGHLLLKLDRKEEGQVELERVARLSRLEKEFDELQEILKPGNPLPPPGAPEGIDLGKRAARCVLGGLLFEEALDSTAKGLLLYPYQRDLSFYHALALVGLGRIDEARAEMQALLREHSDYAPIRDGVARFQTWREKPSTERPSRIELVEGILEAYPP